MIPVPPRPVSPRIRFGVSTYSFWQFNGDPPSIETCIDRAAAMGFDGCEILHKQMGEDQSNGRLQQLKQRAFRAGLDLCGFSTHQSFVKPDPAERQQNVDDTIHQIELAYALGIPTIRVNTGRWGTSKDFDELMANQGIEPRLPGYTDEDGFGWVIGSLEKCLKKAEECGVVMGLENHWGLGRDAAGVLRVIDAIKSPWLQATLDTGNFLEHQYEQYAQLAPAHSAGASEDLPRRWEVVHARHRLPTRGRDPPGGELQRVHLSGDGRESRPGDSGSTEFERPAGGVYASRGNDQAIAATRSFH